MTASRPAAARQVSCGLTASEFLCCGETPEFSASAITTASARVIVCTRSQISCNTSSRMKRSVSNKSRSASRPVTTRRLRICSWSSEKATSARIAS